MNGSDASGHSASIVLPSVQTMRFSSLFFALSLLFSGWIAKAAPDSNQSASAQDAWSIEVVSAVPELTPTAVRARLETELTRMDLPASGQLSITITSERRARVRYLSAEGDLRERSVELPDDPGSALETLGLLSASLVRNDAAELVLGLNPKSDGPEIEPGSEATATNPAELGDAPSSGAQLDDSRPGEAAPELEAEPDAAEPPALEDMPANFSVFHPLAILPHSERLRLHFELGLFYSRVGAVEGLGLNALVLRTEQGSRGVTLAGLWSERSGPAWGLNAAGLVSRGSGGRRGVTVSGLFDFERGDVTGAQIGGLFASSHRVEGLQVSEIALAHDVDGVQLGGLFSSAENVDGAQIGTLSLAHDVEGLQVGVVALSHDAKGGAQIGAVGVARDVNGAQISVVGVARDVDGVQIGAVNVARRVNGTQIGVVNVAEEVSGFPVGLVNIVGNGRNQVVAWSAGPRMPMNLGLKYLHGSLYTLVTVGMSPEEDDRHVYTWGLGFGGRIDIASPFFLEIDGLSQYEDTLRSGDVGTQRLQARAAIGVEVLPWLAFFAGGGPMLSFVTALDDTSPSIRSRDPRFDLHYFGGVQIF